MYHIEATDNNGKKSVSSVNIEVGGEIRNSATTFVTGPYLVRSGQNRTFMIVYSNQGNVDIDRATVVVDVEGDAMIYPRMDGAWDTLTTIPGSRFEFATGAIRPGEEGAVTFGLAAGSGGPFQIKARISSSPRSRECYELSHGGHR